MEKKRNKGFFIFKNQIKEVNVEHLEEEKYEVRWLEFVPYTGGGGYWDKNCSAAVLNQTLFWDKEKAELELGRREVKQERDLFIERKAQLDAKAESLSAEYTKMRAERTGQIQCEQAFMKFLSAEKEILTNLFTHKLTRMEHYMGKLFTGFCLLSAAVMLAMIALLMRVIL